MITLILKQTVSKGFLSVFKLKFDQRTFKNKIIKDVQREVLYRNRPVVFLTLIDKLNKKALFVKQVRPSAILDDIENPYVIEPIAGIVDEGQTPKEAAIREAKEEANIDLDISDLITDGEGYLSPGISNEYAYFYHAYFDSSQYQTGCFGLEEEHEDIQTLLLDIEEIKQLKDNISVSTLMSQRILEKYI
jgi:ADP-ribose pyrophosphatase